MSSIKLLKGIKVARLSVDPHPSRICKIHKEENHKPIVEIPKPKSVIIDMVLEEETLENNELVTDDDIRRSTRKKIQNHRIVQKAKFHPTYIYSQKTRYLSLKMAM